MQLPLGDTAAGSVLLVHDPDSRRLFRLKTWRGPAIPGFLERFDRLQAQLRAWAEPAVPPPVSAWVDATGCPAVLGTFRQGMPLVDRVRSGTLAPAEALSLLTRLEPIVLAAHDRHLAHGSIVPGNILCDGRLTGALLDFGLSAVIGSTASLVERAAADRAGLEALRCLLEQIPAFRTAARPTA